MRGRDNGIPYLVPSPLPSPGGRGNSARLIARPQNLSRTILIDIQSRRSHPEEEWSWKVGMPMQTLQRGLTQEMGRFLATLSYNDLPEEVIEITKSRLIDERSVGGEGPR